MYPESAGLGFHQQLSTNYNQHRRICQRWCSVESKFIFHFHAIALKILIIQVGPELEICGYGCEDAFYEVDTTYHSWEVLAEIIRKDFKDIIIDIGRVTHT